MKYIYLILVLIQFLFGSLVQTQGQTKNKELQEFVIDLSSANIKLRGKLLLFGEYKNDLSNLNYENYIKLLKENETKSSKGVVELIENAEEKYFEANKNSFLIAINSKELNAVLFDNANTSFTDSILIIGKDVEIPDLKEFTSDFKIRQN